MNARQLFEAWAPAVSVWSRWAKPALFTSDDLLRPAPAEEEAPRVSWQLDAATAYLVDLPGARSVDAGLQLARVGYRPVPLFNTAPHQAAVVSSLPILGRLAAGAAELSGLPLRPEAPPAFLLDARRSSPAVPLAPRSFDNRWLVFPQDFPSASFLLSRGVRRVVLVRQPEAGVSPDPDPDLVHVLLRWRLGGLELFRQLLPDQPPQPLELRRPSRFRSLFYRALALAGLKRNSAGGFGSVVPEPSSGRAGIG